ncbi:lipid-A-disaccharide synthase [Desulfococcaceae bacterium HSG7]|nr:lipid-A-disaccharide synthase [Desulfococcaceae bacterium HSG7]
MKHQCVMIIAGETSGDMHGAKVVRAMRLKKRHLFFCGIGGPSLEAAGVRILAESSTLSVVGITEIFSKARHLLNTLSRTKNLLKALRPDLLILIDFPDFNLNVAKTAKRLGIKVLYYISPQIWAWRSGRVKQIKKRVDHIAVILPFEAQFYHKHRVPVTFVGHPLADALPLKREIRNFKSQRQLLESSKPVIGILPGSRDHEVSEHLPVMLASAQILAKRNSDLHFVISVAPSVNKQQVQTALSESEGEAEFEIADSSIGEILDECTLVIAVSGTVTLDAAMSGIPMVIIYKVSSLSYWVGRMLIKVPYIGLVNLIACKALVPELIQNSVTANNIANEVYFMLNNPNALERLRNDLLELRAFLGGSGASFRVAEIACKLIDEEYL